MRPGLPIPQVLRGRSELSYSLGMHPDYDLASYILQSTHSTFGVRNAVSLVFEALAKSGSFPTKISEMYLDFSSYEGEYGRRIREVANGRISYEILRAALLSEQSYPTEMFAGKDLINVSSGILSSARIWNDNFARTTYAADEDEWAFWVSDLSYTHALYRAKPYLGPGQAVELATELALRSRVASSPDEIERACCRLVAEGSFWAGGRISLLPPRSGELEEAVEQSRRHLYLSPDSPMQIRGW